MSNGLVAFAYEGEGCTPYDKRSISCVILYIFVNVNWSSKIQIDSAYHYIYSYFFPFYLATQMVQWRRPVLQNLGFPVSDDPTTIYYYIKPNIDIIKSNHLTNTVKILLSLFIMFTRNIFF